MIDINYLSNIKEVMVFLRVFSVWTMGRMTIINKNIV